MQFRHNAARSIADRVALGRELKRLEGDAIVPFHDGWDAEMVMETFKTGANNRIVAMLNDGWDRTALHLYRDEQGAVIGAVMRLDHPSKGKQVLPLRSTHSSGINPRLEVKAIEAPRPIYRLDQLVRRPDAVVLFVEGEKAADAGQELFPDCVVVTWSGGAQSLGVADLRPLNGRTVIIWPDHDKPGRDAAENLAALLHDVGAAEVRIVQIPADFPPKWDVADAVPEVADA